MINCPDCSKKTASRARNTGPEERALVSAVLTPIRQKPMNGTVGLEFAYVRNIPDSFIQSGVFIYSI